MKISSDGSKLAVAGLDYGNASFVELFNFNKVTGQVTNYGPGSTLVRDVNGDMFYGLEFSPSGNNLYVTTIFKNFKIFNTAFWLAVYRQERWLRITAEVQVIITSGNYN